MKSVSVALSGSGFRFPTHVGALQAILDTGYTITEIAGTSGGAIVAGHYSLGFTPKQMLEISHNTPFQSFIKVDLLSLVENESLNDGSDLLKWLTANLGDSTFSDTIIPVNIISTDLNQQAAFVFNKVNTPALSVAYACRASASLPFIFKPIELNNMYLVDGGVCDDLPLNYLDKQALKFSIELSESSTPLSGKVSVITLLERVMDTFVSANSDDQLVNALNCIPVRINTPPGMTLDTSMTSAQIDELYQLGYDTTTKVISLLL